MAAGAGVAGRCHPGRWSAHGRRRAARHRHCRRETISEVSPGAESCQMVGAGRQPTPAVLAAPCIRAAGTRAHGPGRHD